LDYRPDACRSGRTTFARAVVLPSPAKQPGSRVRPSAATRSGSAVPARIAACACWI